MQPQTGRGEADPSARQKPRVCRRLFAEDEDRLDEGARDNLFNQISEQISRDMDEACKKYNFDFRTEMPLEGDWEWERITDTPQLVPDNMENPPPEPRGKSAPSAPLVNSTKPPEPLEKVDL